MLELESTQLPLAAPQTLGAGGGGKWTNETTRLMDSDHHTHKQTVKYNHEIALRPESDGHSHTRHSKHLVELLGPAMHICAFSDHVLCGITLTMGVRAHVSHT